MGSRKTNLAAATNGTRSGVGRRTALILFLAVSVVVIALPGTARWGPSRTAFAASAPVCRTPLRVTPRLLAPGLRLLKSAYGLGTCPGGIRPTSRGKGGLLWATDSANGLWKSIDDGKTWRRTFRPSNYHNIDRVLQLRSGRVLIVVADPSGRRHILRSTSASGTKFGRPVMDFPFDARFDDLYLAPRLLGSQSWVQAPDGSIYVGEYGQPQTVHLWRSTDDGRSFQVATTFSGVKHIHGVYVDPYASNRLWVAIGDTGTQPRVGYSIDHGKTFTFVSKGVYPESRVVGLMFSKEAVFWGTDTPDVPAGVFRWDRQSGTVSQLLGGLNGPFYYTAQFRTAYAQFSTISLKESDGYLGDEYVHVVASPDGVRWTSARTPWKRAQDNPPRKAVIIGITSPDKRGRFWVSFYDLAGASDASTRTASFELQLIPSSK
jgi:hypothetical protein